MGTGGVFVKVKKPKAIIDRWPDTNPYQIVDISSKITDFLMMQHGYESYDAKELIEWGWQDVEQSEFLEQVKLEYLESGLFTREYSLD